MGIYRAYARVSTDEQSDNSLQNQLKYLSIQAGNLNFEVKTYQEKQSGKDIKGRLELQRLLSHLQPGDIVGFYDGSRMGRNTEENLNIANQIIAAGAQLQINGRMVNPNIPGDKLLLTIESAVSTFERENTLLKSRIGMETMKEKGDWIFAGRLLGYEVVKKSGKVHVSVDKEGAEIIKYIYSRFLDGASFKQITDEINAKGWRTQNNTLFNFSQIRRYIFRPIYMGYYPIKGIGRKSEYYNVRDLGKDDLVKSNHYPAIISEDDWWKAYHLYHNYNKKHVRKGKQRFSKALLSGILRCDKCDTGFFRHDRSGEKKPPTYPTNYVNRVHDKNVCDLSAYTLHAPILDDITKNIFVLMYLFSDELYALEQKKKEKYISQLKIDDEDVHRLELLIAETDKKMENLYRAIESGIDPEIIKSRINDVNKEKRGLERDLLKAQQQKNITQMELEEEIDFHIAEAIHDFFIVDGNMQRKILKTFFKRMFITGDAIHVDLIIDVRFIFHYHKVTKVYLQEEFEIDIYQGGEFKYTVIHDRWTKKITVKPQGKKQAEGMLQAKIDDLFRNLDLVD
jgi:site-specific DNA recombinase